MARTSRPLRLEALKHLIENSGLSFNDKNRKSWVLDCPKCGKEDKLYIRRRDGRAVCWYCKERPDGIDGAPEYALAPLLGKSVGAIKDVLYGPDFVATKRIDTPMTFSVRRAAVARDDGEDDYGESEEYEAVPANDTKLVGLDFPLNFYDITAPQAVRGMEYLNTRGITADVATRYGLAYDAPRRRVVFPVRSRGVLVGWQARTVGASEWVDDEGRTRTVPKILTTMLEGMRENVLMFEERLLGSPHAVLTEGPVDALKCDLCGGNVDSMGKTVSDGQIARLKAFGVKKLYLAQDPDAYQETADLVRRCHEDFELWYMTSEGTGFEDFGAMPPEVALERFRAAERVHSRRIFSYDAYHP